MDNGVTAGSTKQAEVYNNPVCHEYNLHSRKQKHV